jgi:LPS export ABC transporter protein LptC
MTANILNIQKIKRMLLLTIGVMTAIMGYYIWAYNRQKPQVEAERLGTVPDADVVVKNFEVVETFNDRVLWSLRAKGAEVYSAQKETYLRGVEADFFDENDKNLHLISDSGKKDDASGLIVVSGNVQATSIQEGIVLKTDELKYDMATKKIFTDKHVIIERGNTITEGDGLRSDIDLRRAKILSNIKTSFNPTE